MTLSELSIKRPVFAWMLMLAMLIFGWFSFKQLGVSQLPDVDFPIISVNVTLEGAAPEVMESEVADVLEDVMMGIPGIKEISSTSRQGQVSLSIEFDLSKDIDVAVQEVQTKVAQAQRNLPKDIDPPVISKTNPEDQPIMWVALSGDRDVQGLMNYARDYLKDQFTTVTGVGEVILGGYIEPNIRVWVDGDALYQKELTVKDVISTLELQHQEIPAGRIENHRNELNVRFFGQAKTMQDFENLLVTGRGGSPLWVDIRLGEVARVEDGLADVRRISRSMEKSSVGFGIRKQRGVNAVEVANAVKDKVSVLQQNLPKDLKLNVVFDTTKFIEEASHELNFTLILSALLTALVCWIFIQSLRSAFNIVMAIPVSILGTFIFMHFLGFTLNTFTLLGLSLVIGIVVDDAIMVLENIVRHAQMGKKKRLAARDGANEITFAAIAATIAILAIFIPVIFMKGIIGKFFFQFGMTISIAVAISLLEALTLAPMRASRFLEVPNVDAHPGLFERTIEKITRGYTQLLLVVLRYRVVVMFGALIFLIGSFFLVTQIKKEFVPSQDQGRFLVRIQTPIGSSLAFTDQVFKELESKVLKIEGVERYFAAVGGFGGGEVHTGMMFVTLKPLKERPSHKVLMDQVRRTFKNVKGVEKVNVQDLSLSGFSAQRGYPVEFSLRGNNWDKLGELSETLKKKMEATGVMTDVDSDYILGLPEVQIIPNREAANARGVNLSDIGQTIQAMIGGVRAGKYTKGGRREDIRVRLMPEQRELPEQIAKLWVRNNRGELVRLSEVVTLQVKPTLSAITRKNRERAISVFANVANGHSQSDALAQVEDLAKDILPEGYRIVLSGSAQTYKESFSSLLFALGMGILVAYMVLASQFNSFIQPIIILLTLPFSISGAFFALFFTGQSLNLYSMIGILLLMGLVKKNGILLVDFANQNRDEGCSTHEALMKACPVRLRPILMTSVATIAAAIPPALAIGPGAETRIPMAVVIIGGIIVSTILSLIVVPCAYSFTKESVPNDDLDNKN